MAPESFVQRKGGRPTCVIADDNELILDQIERLLQVHYEVVARVRDGRALLEIVAEKRPAIAVVDVSMPELDGIEATKVISRSSVDTRVVILTVHTELAYVEAAFDAGADGYVVKFHADQELLTAVTTVLNDGFYLSQMLRDTYQSG